MPDSNRVVFVVDDEVVIADTLAVILNQAGFQARAFDHPQKAKAMSFCACESAAVPNDSKLDNFCDSCCLRHSLCSLSGSSAMDRPSRTIR